jgi:hypothetical protein
LTGFLRQIISTMQNWHDTLQSELTGFHDRIAHIALAPGEGGLSITMPEPLIESVDKKGTAAGLRLLETFEWENHQLQRYQVLMGMLQDGLVPRASDKTTSHEDNRSPNVHSAWTNGLAEQIQRYASESPDGRPCQWYADAAAATQKLLDDANAWLGDLPTQPPDQSSTPPTRLQFRPDRPLTPPASMRIAPDV